MFVIIVICVNTQVISKSEEDGNYYVNAMVLHQQQAIDTDVILKIINESSQSKELGKEDMSVWQSWIHYKSQRRIWRYWLERLAISLKHGPPTGLYNAKVRQRFKTMMTDAGLD